MELFETAGMVGGYEINIKTPEVLKNIDDEEDDPIYEHMKRWGNAIANQDCCNKLLVEIDGTEYEATIKSTVIK